jgi:hypothetical protein
VKKPRKQLSRLVEMIGMVRQPPPLSYDITPRNRAQRRMLARELQRLARRKGRAE